jgi:hypothetical protein
MRSLRFLPAWSLLLGAAAPLRAQEFVPPDRRPAPPSQAPAQSPAPASSGFLVDVLGFSTRGGFQVNKGGQVLLGSTIDIAQLGTPQVRLRPSFEVGFGQSSTSIGINAEVVYRFQPDAAPAIPYLGLGWGYYDDRSTKRGWATVAMGFELPFKRNMNWLLEYHALDALKRSRFFVGLATRGGG